MTIRIDGTNTAANPGITGSDTDTGLQFGTDEVNIVTGGSSRVTVDSNGNFGIGTASIDSNTNYNTLEIVGDTSSGGGIVRLKTGDRTTAKTMLFCDTGGFEARVETNHPFVISTNNSERLRVLAGGGLTFNGDTAAANALDDYEEGSWTPTFANAGTLTYSVQVGRYTKIGNLVHATCHLDVNVKGTASGDLRISGLPFTSIDVNNYHAVSSTVHGTGWSTARRSLNILLSRNQATTNSIYHNMTATTQSSNPSITGSDWGLVSHDDLGTGNLLFSITYQAA